MKPARNASARVTFHVAGRLRRYFLRSPSRLYRSAPVVKNTLLLGSLLTILGAGTFALLGFDPAKATALLPAAFGVVFLALGGVATWQPAWGQALVATAVGLAGLAFLGAAPGLWEALELLAGRDVDRPAAAVEQGIQALLCFAFVGWACKQYLDDRRHVVGEGA